MLKKTAIGTTLDELERHWMPFTSIRDFRQRRNSIVWYDNNGVGTEFDVNRSCAGMAEGCDHRGVTARRPAELTESLIRACAAQARVMRRAVDLRPHGSAPPANCADSGIP